MLPVDRLGPDVEVVLLDGGPLREEGPGAIVVGGGQQGSALVGVFLGEVVRDGARLWRRSGVG